jgi:CRP/FNR family transcriptional activator FtrB
LRAEEERFAAALPFFEGLTEASVKQLLGGALLQRFPMHAGIIRQGGSPEFLHVVVEGRVEVFTSYRDRETTVDVLGADACFIMAAVFLDKPYLKSARALSPARLLLIHGPAVREVLRKDLVFAEKCGAELAEGYRRLVKEVNNLKLRSSLERLANWLLHHASRDEINARFVIPFDKKTLAAKLGIAPEVLSRNFAALAAHGVKVTGKSVEVTDLQLLESLAQPLPEIDDPGY